VNGGEDFDFYLARFDPDGTLEANFGGPAAAAYSFDQWHLPNGSAASDLGTDAAMAVAFTDDGILAGGGVTRGSSQYFGLLRYRPPTASNISVSATARPDGTISLNWIDGSWSEEGYLVERALDDADFGPDGNPENVVTLAYLGGEVSSLVDRHVDEATRYYYRVTALKLTSSGNDVEPDPAHQSNIASAFTLPTDVGWKPIDSVVFEDTNLRGSDLFSHVPLSSNGIYLLRASGVFDLGEEHDGSDASRMPITRTSLPAAKTGSRSPGRVAARRTGASPSTTPSAATSVRRGVHRTRLTRTTPATSGRTSPCAFTSTTGPAFTPTTTRSRPTRCASRSSAPRPPRPRR
jgi:hypothetical protein